ncbi:13717_t:CDS:2 [Dentiscutata erythropus]|uniref:13717_t:CDS:1 n=1 Tax=Dentiscutata erythropus TaxID=1348616 RepID=A0A9N9NI91_9GLOM|nr:13717_t:CDS:2 [Dentiscutata erythropus]
MLGDPDTIQGQTEFEYGHSSISKSLSDWLEGLKENIDEHNEHTACHMIDKEIVMLFPFIKPEQF